MGRSGSQKVLLVVSVIEIVGAVLSLITDFMFFLGAGAVLSDPTVVAGSGIAQDEAAGYFVILSGLLIVEGLWSLLCGILGVRAANNNQKIMIVWVFSLIALVMAVLGIMFFIANNIKNEAGR